MLWKISWNLSLDIKCSASLPSPLPPHQQISLWRSRWNSIHFYRLSLNVCGWCHASSLRVSCWVHLGFILKKQLRCKSNKYRKRQLFCWVKLFLYGIWAVLPAFLFRARSRAGHSPVVWTDTLRLLFKFSLCVKRNRMKAKVAEVSNWLTSSWLTFSKVTINKRSWCT